MFFLVGVYAYVVAGLDFLFRFFPGEYGRSLRNKVLTAIQSFGSDRSVNDGDMLLLGFFMNTIEMFIFLIVLNTLKTPALIQAKSQGASTALTVVACLTWLTRCIFYMWPEFSELLVDKDTPMASRESENSNNVSVNRVEDSDNMV